MTQKWYYLMMGAWLLFLIPACVMRPRGVAKFLIWLSLVGGILAASCEYALYFWLGGGGGIFFLLFCVWGLGVRGIYLCARNRDLGRVRRVVGSIAAVPIFLAIGVHGVDLQRGQYYSRQMGKQLDRQFDLKAKRLFEAPFRSVEAYRRYFGPVAEDVSMGHYETSHPPYTRLVLNTDNQMWLFYRCGHTATECHLRPARLERDTVVLGPGTMQGAGSRVTVIAKTPQELTLDIRPETPETGGASSGRRVVFRASAPPIRADAPADALRYLGSYGTWKRVGPRSGRFGQWQRVRLTQWWVWQDHDSLYAVRADDAERPARRPASGRGMTFSYPEERGIEYFFPEVLGRGRLDASTGAYVFDAVTPHLVVRKVGDTLIVSSAEANAPHEPLTLEAADFFIREDIFTSAPLESATAWTQWFETMLVGKRLEWVVPAERRVTSNE